MADATLLISVVVPAHNAGESLGQCIDALIASDLPRSQWELIVVDDASTDDTSEIGERANRLIRVSDFPRGPAFARNRGAEVALARVIVFVDADVCVHADALSRLLDHFRANPDIAAVFGSYDDAPAGRSVQSQYRNLLHHYVHQQNTGETGSFWAGLGAIRASDFRETGMFDEIRYSRPQIEDVELGYRLRQRGRRIVLDPGVRGRHLKRWTIPGIVRTDLLQRGIPWVRLLLERGPAAARGPSLGAREILSVGLIGTAVLLLLTSVVAARRVELAAAAVLCLGASVAVSSPFHLWIWKKRGARVGLASIPLYLLYHLISVAAVVAGSVVFLFRDAPPIAISGGQQDGAAPSRSFAGFAAGEAGSRALAFIATAYIARKLGVSAFGYLGFATAVVAYFGTALSAGISEVGSREVARHPRDAQTIAAGATLIRLVAAVIALAGVIAISMVVPEPRLGRVVLALTGLSLISLALDTSWVYKGFGKSRRVGAGLLLGQSLAVGLLLLLVRAPENVVRVPIIQFFADVVAAAFLITPLLGRAWLSPRISEAIGLVKSSGLITLSRILRTLIVTIDVVLLGIMTSSEQVGLYSAAYRIVFFVMAIAYASHVAWLPAVTRTIAGRRPVDTVFAGSLRLSLAVTLPFVVGGLMIAPQLLRAIFGEEYSPAATALRLLLVSLFFIALHGASRNLFLAYERLGIETWIMAAGVVVNVGLNLALIPRYGLNGAALATAAADGVILILCAVAVARFGIRPSLWLLVVPLAAGGAMAVGLWLIGLDRPAVISIMVGAIIYGGALAVLTHLSRGWQTVQLSPAADAVQ